MASSRSGVDVVVDSLDTIHERIAVRHGEIRLLRRVLNNPRVMHLCEVCARLYHFDPDAAPPFISKASVLSEKICSKLELIAQHRAADELLDLLTSPHVMSLLHTHDDVASHNYVPRLPDEIYDDSEEIADPHAALLQRGTYSVIAPWVPFRKNFYGKILCDIRHEGVTIQSNRRGQIQIARVIHGGLADRCGFLHIGDLLYEVNGLKTFGIHPDDVATLLSNCGETVTLKISPATRDGSTSRECQTRVKAFMGYDPYIDTLNPCPRASLKFRRGDILHVVNRDDKYWWQARIEGDVTRRVGLIPCRQLQERQKTLRKSQSHEEKLGDKSICDSLCNDCCGLDDGSPRRVMYQVIESPVYDRSEVFTYEEVSIYTPPPGRYRPIVLIGANGVGRNELKRRLVASNPAHFKELIPYTSRSPRSHERDGRDYHFVSRAEMEQYILQNRFCEYGQYRGNLYGTSLHSIAEKIRAGKVCVLTPHVQAVKPLRIREIRPYFIFIKPPNFVQLIRTRTASKAKLTVEHNLSRSLNTEDCQTIIKDTEKYDHLYGHFFDYILVNDNLRKTADDLIKVATAIEAVPQWVPAAWT